MELTRETEKGHQEDILTSYALLRCCAAQGPRDLWCLQEYPHLQRSVLYGIQYNTSSQVLQYLPNANVHQCEPSELGFRCSLSQLTTFLV